MIKLFKEIIETIKWVVSGKMALVHPLMLPGGRSIEMAEQKPTKADLNLARLIQNLPPPDKEGLRITLVGQGFKRDVVVSQGRWYFDG